ncbi:hypothetical protein mvi_51750 [Methylobacterium indicum]|uniref:Uncharacterized protein n=1 Tax=Methylobacterium indicum TaxID=1775910 RepID=A0A8H8WYE0_9HYPH|nr:hypothetical protein mvi_51750 [Methylobacterium indicum]
MAGVARWPELSVPCHKPRAATSRLNFQKEPVSRVGDYARDFEEACGRRHDAQQREGLRLVLLEEFSYLWANCIRDVGINRIEFERHTAVGAIAQGVNARDASIEAASWEIRWLRRWVEEKIEDDLLSLSAIPPKW